MWRRIRRTDVEAVAGLIAAVTALVLHLLHLVDPDVLLVVIMVILALMLIRDLRREDRDEHAAESAQHIEGMVSQLVRATAPPESTLIGPRTIRDESSIFSREARGEMTWFNVCLSMFEPQSLFDALLRPALENPETRSVQFILDHGERERWESTVLPKARAIGAQAKLAEPVWTSLAEPVSCILAETDASGRVEALLSFWGEPFMARGLDRDIPRYVFRIHSHSDLIPHLTELVRRYRLSTR
jgi:hypothetical protein